MLHISLRQRESEVFLLVGFFKDAERNSKKEQSQILLPFFKKRGKNKNAFCKKSHGVICDKILMKSKLYY